MEFRLTVYREPAGVSSISVDATDEQAALRQAVAGGYLVLSAQRRGGWNPVRREGAFPLLLVSQELLSLLRAGINLVEAFETLAEKEQAGATRSVIERILAELYTGKPLSAALEVFPGVFSPLYIATIRASERTGDIVQALERYVAYQSQLERVRKMIVTAMIYPVLLIAVGGVVTLFLLGYVVPRFSRIFLERGTDIPFLTKVLVEWGNLINQYSWQTWLAVLGVIALVVIAARRPQGRAFLVRQLWKVPGAGEKMRLYQLARLYRTVGMLLRGGMPIVSALGLVVGLLAPAMRGQLSSATRQISDGGATSQAMLDHGLATPVATRMLRVGEQTGDLGGMMEQIAAFYDEDIARTAEVFTRTFEPVLMVFIGLVIGSIVLLMYLPIFELASTME
jgi:general secretion pathway protein F